ncbi:hypothetical protein OF83DRAFT_1176418, partial [Amylostereum chailletii]
MPDRTPAVPPDPRHRAPDTVPHPASSRSPSDAHASEPDAVLNKLTDRSIESYNHADKYHAALSASRAHLHVEILPTFDDLTTHLLHPVSLQKFLSTLLDTSSTPDARQLRDSANMFKGAFDQWCAQASESRDRILASKIWMEDTLRTLEENASRAHNLASCTRDAANEVRFAHASIVQRHKDARTKLSAELATLEDELEGEKASSAQLERHLEIEIAAIQQLRDANARLQANLAAERSRKVQLEATTASLQTKCADQADRIDELENANGTLQDKLEAERRRRERDADVHIETLVAEKQKAAGLAEQLANATHNLHNQARFTSDRIDALKREKAQADVQERLWREKWTHEAQEKVKTSKELAWLKKQQAAMLAQQQRRGASAVSPVSPTPSSSKLGALASLLATPPPSAPQPAPRDETPSDAAGPPAAEAESATSPERLPYDDQHPSISSLERSLFP